MEKSFCKVWEFGVQFSTVFAKIKFLSGNLSILPISKHIIIQDMGIWDNFGIFSIFGIFGNFQFTEDTKIAEMPKMPKMPKISKLS